MTDLDSSLFLVIVTTNWEFEIQCNADISCFLSPLCLEEVNSDCRYQFKNFMW